MSKKELIDAVSEKADLTKEKASVAVEAMLAYIEGTLKKGGEVSIPPLGKFKVTRRKEREGINPLTKAPLKIPAANVPKFTPSKSLKESINS